MELYVFGGGNNNGESILVKLPDDSYGVIDCFNNPSTRKPYIIEFLEDKDIDPEKISFILLTHLHNDHCGGIIELLDLCPNAIFYTSALINNVDYQTVINLASTIDFEIDGYAKAKKIFEYLKKKKRTATSVASDTVLFKNDICSIEALSPTNETLKHYEAHYKTLVKNLNSSDGGSLSGNVQLSRDYNMHSVVVKYQWNDTIVILASDLEYSKTYNFGLHEVISELISNDLKLAIVKVSHHGSVTGYNNTHVESDPSDWTSLFNKDEVILALTPWKEKLPSDKMIPNFLSWTKYAYITSNPKEKYVKPKQREKRAIAYTGLNIKPLSNHFGYIRIKQKEGKLIPSMHHQALLLSQV